MSKYQAKIIVLYAQASMNRSGVAKILGVNTSTLTYHFNVIQDKTGLDPRNFFDLGELYTIARDILDNKKE